jgi:hypothetical protein
MVLMAYQLEESTLGTHHGYYFKMKEELD